MDRTLIGQWLTRRQGPVIDERIVPLTAADVARLDLGWRTLFTPEELRRHLAEYPSRSFWMPATREYVVGGGWRHRRELASLVELSARGDHRAPLVEAVLAAGAAEGCPLVIFSDTSEQRSDRWYQQVGFELIQEIIVYELHGPREIAAPSRRRLTFEPIEDDIPPALLDVDHRAFPYLWWNSQAEFEHYLDQRGVRIYLGHDAAGTPIAYAGITLYQGWGHLDRLAVVPELQGQGLGRETLAFAVERVQASGARRVGLSTQADNTRSQVLYERYGFRRTYRTDYTIYGHWLVDDPAARRAVLTTPVPSTEYRVPSDE